MDATNNHAVLRKLGMCLHSLTQGSSIIYRFVVLN